MAQICVISNNAGFRGWIMYNDNNHRTTFCCSQDKVEVLQAHIVCNDFIFLYMQAREACDWWLDRRMMRA